MKEAPNNELLSSEHQIGYPSIAMIFHITDMISERLGLLVFY
jgi:hypothetical protein